MEVKFFLLPLLSLYFVSRSSGNTIDSFGNNLIVSQESLTQILKLAQSEENLNFAIRLRRELHKIPELMFQEKKTSELIQKTLKELGIEYETGYAETGVIGQVGSGSQPIVALRADMDALPIQEQNELEFMSQNDGRMHACGHDAHVAMLLTAAKLLKSREKELIGTVKFIFQPAEEGGAGGQKLIQQNGLKDVKRVFAFHVWPDLPTGTVGGNVGVMMAASGLFHATIKGKGGHGAMPHKTIDPILSVASIITSLQSLVSRETDPLESSVVSVTRIHGGFADNVIPEKVEIGGTFRSFTKKGFQYLKKRIVEVITTQAMVSGCEGSVSFETDKHPFYPPTVNEKSTFSFAINVVDRMLGNDAYIKTNPSMGGEDFSFYLEQVPGSILLLGIRNETVGSVYGLHHPKFLLDENVLPIGVALHVALAEESTKSVRLANE